MSKARDILRATEDVDGRSIFLTQQFVRFGHVDPAGIAYFPRIYNYLHEAFEDLWEHYIGVPYYHLLGNERVAFPLVHSEVDFKRPLKFGSRPVVKVTCFKLGQRSLGLRYRYELEGELCVDARMTTACIDLDSMKSQPIPHPYRERFVELLDVDGIIE
jgi:4-hydroxybenzoyl-CoA thioesterase